VEDVEEEDGVTLRIFPFEEVLPFESDAGHVDGGLAGDADFVFVVIDTAEGAGVAAVVEPVRSDAVAAAEVEHKTVWDN